MGCAETIRTVLVVTESELDCHAGEFLTAARGRREPRLAAEDRNYGEVPLVVRQHRGEQLNHGDIVGVSRGIVVGNVVILLRGLENEGNVPGARIL